MHNISGKHAFWPKHCPKQSLLYGLQFGQVEKGQDAFFPIRIIFQRLDVLF
jgi:hypothetical protein